jgi:hypothetical protein
VRVSGAGARTTRTRVADRPGRLRIGVALGPVNHFDEDSPQSLAAGAPHRATATVRIAPARAR